VSGTVSSLTCSAECIRIGICNDLQNEISGDVIPFGKKSPKLVTDIDADDLISVVKDAGRYDGVYSAVPAWEIFKRAKVNPKLRRIVVNCLDNDPFVYSAELLSIKEKEKLVGGIKIILAALKIRNAVIAVSNACPDQLSELKREVLGEAISVKAFSSKYPGANEAQIVYELTGRELSKDKKGVDIGTVVLDAISVVEIYNAFVYGEPSTHRAVTVNGDAVNKPTVLWTPMGTPVSELIGACGINEKCTDIRVLLGGSLCPISIDDLSHPVDHTTDSVLVFKAKKRSLGKSVFLNSNSCDRCGKCVQVCPIRLNPSRFAELVEKGKTKLLPKYGIDQCILCGACQYVCPAGVPLTEYIKVYTDPKPQNGKELDLPENGGEPQGE
jgi:electron transport complex protein RnfC